MEQRVVNEKDLNDLLVWATNHGYVELPLDDKVVDSVLQSTPEEISERVKNHFKSRLKERLIEEAISSARICIPWEGLPFGRYLEAVRSRAGLSREVVAARLQKTDEYLHRIERGDTSPVQLPVSEIVVILELFHIGLHAATQMLQASDRVSESKQNYRAAARSHGGVRHDIRSEDVEKALDAFARKLLKNKGKEWQSPDRAETAGFMTKVETELKKRGRSDLLG